VRDCYRYRASVGFCDATAEVTQAASLEIILVGRFCELRKLSRADTDALQLNQAATRRVSDSFGSADDIHLREDAFHVRLDGAFTNKER
jgi:hypothetical protein